MTFAILVRSDIYLSLLSLQSRQGFHHLYYHLRCTLVPVISLLSSTLKRYYQRVDIANCLTFKILIRGFGPFHGSLQCYAQNCWGDQLLGRYCCIANVHLWRPRSRGLDLSLTISMVVNVVMPHLFYKVKRCRDFKTFRAASLALLIPYSFLNFIMYFTSLLI